MDLGLLNWDWHEWVVPTLFVLAGLIAGVIMDRVLAQAMRQMFKAMAGDETASLLKGTFLWLLTVSGVYLATYSIPHVSPEMMVAFRKGLLIVAILAAIRIFANATVAMVRHYARHHTGLQELPSTSIFENILRISVYLLGLLVLLQTMGVSVIPIITALGVGGLAISLALQDTLANLFAGIHMIAARQIKVGDYVQLEGGHEGVVEDIGWRTTTLRRLSNNVVIVPNTKMATNIITNCTLPLPEMSLYIELAVGYGSNLEQVETICTEVAHQVVEATGGGASETPPQVRFHTFGDSGILFRVIIQVQQFADQFVVKHEFIKHIYQRLSAAGIEIPYPHRTLHADAQLLEALQGVVCLSPSKGEQSS